MYRDDDMQSIASIMITDNSCDIGVIADIDNDDSDDENHQAVDSIVDRDSSLTVSDLALQFDKSFGHDSSAHGMLMAEFYVFVLGCDYEINIAEVVGAMHSFSGPVSHANCQISLMWCQQNCQSSLSLVDLDEQAVTNLHLVIMCFDMIICCWKTLGI